MSMDDKIVDFNEEFILEIDKLKYVTFEMEDGTKQTITKMEFEKYLSQIFDNAGDEECDCHCDEDCECSCHEDDDISEHFFQTKGFLDYLMDDIRNPKLKRIVFPKDTSLDETRKLIHKLFSL